MKRILIFAGRYFFVLGAALYGFTVGVFFKKFRKILIETSERLGFPSQKGADLGRQILPKVPVWEIVQTDLSIKILEPSAKSGNVSFYELIVMNLLVRAFAPKSLLEIGTFDGRTTLNLAAHSPADAKIYTLDLPKQKMEDTKLAILEGDKTYIDKERSGLRFQAKPEAAKIVQLLGDSARFDFGPFLGQIDFVFVDGAHSPDYVVSDTKVALSLLRGGKGIILWHDYKPNGNVTRTLNRMAKEWPELTNTVWIEDTWLACLIIR